MKKKQLETSTSIVEEEEVMSSKYDTGLIEEIEMELVTVKISNDSDDVEKNDLVSLEWDHLPSLVSNHCIGYFTENSKNREWIWDGNEEGLTMNTLKMWCYESYNPINRYYYRLVPETHPIFVLGVFLYGNAEWKEDKGRWIIDSGVVCPRDTDKDGIEKYKSERCWAISEESVTHIIKEMVKILDDNNKKIEESTIPLVVQDKCQQQQQQETDSSNTKEFKDDSELAEEGKKKKED
jgi:hypothetical protein